MNRKLFGERFAVLVAVAALMAAGCEKKIPGEPEKTVERYVKAVQAQEYKTIFEINALSARQLKHLRLSAGAEKEKSIAQAMEKFQQAFNDAPVTFQPGITWAEKNYFPAGAQVTVGTAYWPQKVGDDPVNAEYEKYNNCFVPVAVDYAGAKQTPENDGKKVKSAQFDCSLKKIREGQNVTVYSHDDLWYVGGCIATMGKITYQ